MKLEKILSDFEWSECKMKWCISKIFTCISITSLVNCSTDIPRDWREGYSIMLFMGPPQRQPNLINHGTRSCIGIRSPTKMRNAVGKRDIKPCQGYQYISIPLSSFRNHRFSALDNERQ